MVPAAIQWLGIEEDRVEIKMSIATMGVEIEKEPKHAPRKQ